MQMRIGLSAKILGLSLGAMLIASQLGVQAAATYGSTVNIGGLFKYGYAWTSESGKTVRARIVIGGDLSDITATGYAQTEQISSTAGKIAYINHYSNGTLIASYEK